MTEHEKNYRAMAKRNSNRWLVAAAVSFGGVVTGIMAPSLAFPAMIVTLATVGFTLYTQEQE